MHPTDLKAYLLSRFEARAVRSDPEEVVLKHCPSCGDHKWRTYANVRKGIAYCQRHGCITRLKDLVDGETPFTVFEEEEREKEDIWPHLTYDWDCCKGARMARLYAQKRGLSDVFLSDQTLGYFTGGPLQGRLGIVVRDVSTLQPIYAVGRSLNGEKPKYLYPATVDAGRGKGEVVFNLHRFPKGCKRLVVVEGSLSALSAPDCIACLGNGISDEQAYLILEHQAEEVYYTYEENIHPYHAILQAAKLASRGQRTYLAPLLRGDFNDDPTQFNEVLANVHRLTPLAYPLGELPKTHVPAMRAFLGMQDPFHVGNRAPVAAFAGNSW